MYSAKVWVFDVLSNGIHSLTQMFDDTTDTEAMTHFHAWMEGTADFFMDYAPDTIHGPVVKANLYLDKNFIAGFDKQENMDYKIRLESWMEMVNLIDLPDYDLDIDNLHERIHLKEAKEMIPTWSETGEFYCWFESIEDIVKSEQRYDWMGTSRTKVEIINRVVITTYPSGVVSRMYLDKPTVKSN